jgi:SpoVK/Ycf46/Vps4 family AAA+-type ATPase
MTTSPTVLAALEAALKGAPDDIGLRNHYAQLLLDDGQHGAALDVCARTLALDPVNVAALRIALQAAKAEGNPAAQGYARLLEALTGSAGKPAAAPPAGGGGEDIDDDDTDDSGEDLGDDDDTDDSDEDMPRLMPHGGPRLAASDGEIVEEFEVQAPSVKFSDVGGMEHVKKRLEISVLGPIRNPELYKAFGKTGTGGLLLYGPPGCGKTFMARALAGEMGARFATIGLEDVLNKYFGESEQRLHKIFDTARRLAPMVIFFDEIDAIGHKRSELRGNMGRNLVNMLLAEMDGAQHDNKDVFVLAATNHPWDVDTALRRPGRFDRTVLVLPPDEPARVSILQKSLEDCPTDGVNVAEIAKKTELFSGADLAHLCMAARERAIELSANEGRIVPVRQEQLLRALKEVKPSTVEWFTHARNFAMFANESGVYDELLEYMKKNRLG